MGLIQLKNIQEGEIFCKWLNRRLIVSNKNVLGVNLGGTGTGKSYRDLRQAELWYNYHFKEKFPIKNICFGLEQVMKRISSGEMRRGEVLIVEEAGVNLGSLDFQNKLSKMFTYVLQSFRSMNVALFFNLPHMGMLNKTARLLLHYSFESAGIDSAKKLNKCKPFLHQVNQGTGKIYKKYMYIKYKGQSRQVKEFSYSLPSKYLMDAYEEQKKKYIDELTKDITKQMDTSKGKLKRMPNNKKYRAFDLHNSGKSYRLIGEMLGVAGKTAFEWAKEVEHWEKVTKEGK